MRRRSSRRIPDRLVTTSGTWYLSYGSPRSLEKGLAENAPKEGRIRRQECVR